MRLVQKSLLHSGYYITKNGETIPSFTDDPVNEAMMNSERDNIIRVYGALKTEETLELCRQIKIFKRKHGVSPQNLTEFLRTGFFTNGELKQAHNLFIYK